MNFDKKTQFIGIACNGYWTFTEQGRRLLTWNVCSFFCFSHSHTHTRKSTSSRHTVSPDNTAHRGWQGTGKMIGKLFWITYNKFHANNRQRSRHAACRTPWMGYSDNYCHLQRRKKVIILCKVKPKQQHTKKKQTMQHAGNHHQMRWQGQRERR